MATALSDGAGEVEPIAVGCQEGKRSVSTFVHATSTVFASLTR